MNIKSIMAIIATVFVLGTLVVGCERIDAGHVGMKVSYFGDEKGVNDITYATGITFISPFTTKIVEWPTYVQHIEYRGEDGFVINSKDGTEFGVNPVINYQITSTKAPSIYRKFRVDLKTLEQAYLKTAIQDAFRMTANTFPADSLVSSRQRFETLVFKTLCAKLDTEGFYIQQLTSNLVYPESFKNAINSKNAAIQSALQAENNVKTAEANAKIQVAKARGNADAMLMSARAESEANKLKQATLTPMLLQQQWIDKWDGAVPSTQLGTGANVMYGLK
jgi:regulator of protease activity HflC (stomatin/prohibitin superfamily)